MWLERDESRMDRTSRIVLFVVAGVLVAAIAFGVWYEMSQNGSPSPAAKARQWAQQYVTDPVSSLAGLAGAGAEKAASGAGHGPAMPPPQLMESKQPPRADAYPSTMTATDLLHGNRKRSNKAAGLSSEGDHDPRAYNHNMVGSYMAPHDPKTGSSRPYMASMPSSSGSRELGSSSIGSKRGGRGLMGKRTPINLEDYAGLGVDRTVGAQGLDLPEDLALASAQLGHMEVSANTRTDSWHPWGETPHSWNVGAIINQHGEYEPGNGIIPTYGPGQLALRTRGANF